MKKKPRWMKSVIETAKTELPPLRMGRHSAGSRYVAGADAKSSPTRA